MYTSGGAASAAEAHTRKKIAQIVGVRTDRFNVESLDCCFLLIVESLD
jgi:hypothetical protein